MSLPSSINILNFVLNLRSPHSNFLSGNVYECVYTHLVSFTITALLSNRQEVVACFPLTAELQRLEI